MLEDHALVQVHVNLEHPDIVVHPSLLERPDRKAYNPKAPRCAMFEMGLNLPVPPVGWDFGEHELRVTLSFARQPFACVFPWEAIFMIDSGQFNDASAPRVVWPWSASVVQPELFEGLKGPRKVNELLDANGGRKPPEPPKPLHLKAVK